MTRRPTSLPAPSLPSQAGSEFAVDLPTADLKAIFVRVDPQVRKELKHLAADLDRTTQSLMLEAIDLLFAKHRNRPPAS